MSMLLAQGEYWFHPEVADPVLFVAGGRPPSVEWLRVVGKTMPVWAVDRGIETCRRAGITPERLIGDADSSSSQEWTWAVERGIPVELHHRDKDDTDLQLALRELAQARPTADVLLAGGLGRRFDHAYSNIFSLLQAREWGLRPVGLVDDMEALFLLEDSSSMEAVFNRPPSVVSLLPCSPVCRGVSLRGVHWPLMETELSQYRPSAICNRPARDENRVRASIGTGILGVYFCWEEIGL